MGTTRSLSGLSFARHWQRRDAFKSLEHRDLQRHNTRLSIPESLNNAYNAYNTPPFNP
jgi:hypothetical protein